MDGRYGLIFDVDGVIADTEGVNFRATRKVFAELFDVPDVKREDFEAGIGRGAEAYVLAAARVHGLELSDEQVQQAVQARQDNFLEILEREPLPPFPGVLELIEAGLNDVGFLLAIATSGSREKSRAVLQSAGIPYQRMAYITGDDVSWKKPDPEIFLTAANRLELAPDHCLVIEDAPDGVKAAKAAGTVCLAVTNTTTAHHLDGADLIVDSLANVHLVDIRRLIDGEL